MVKDRGDATDESFPNPSTRKAHPLSSLTEDALPCSLTAGPESKPELLGQAKSELHVKGKEVTSVVVGSAHGTTRMAGELELQVRETERPRPGSGAPCGKRAADDVKDVVVVGIIGVHVEGVVSCSLTARLAS